jgi:hypothetical protein
MQHGPSLLEQHADVLLCVVWPDLDMDTKRMLRLTCTGLRGDVDALVGRIVQQPRPVEPLSGATCARLTSVQKLKLTSVACLRAMLVAPSLSGAFPRLQSLCMDLEVGAVARWGRMADACRMGRCAWQDACMHARLLCPVAAARTNAACTCALITGDPAVGVPGARWRRALPHRAERTTS